MSYQTRGTRDEMTATITNIAGYTEKNPYIERDGKGMKITVYSEMIDGVTRWWGLDAYGNGDLYDSFEEAVDGANDGNQECRDECNSYGGWDYND